MRALTKMSRYGRQVDGCSQQQRPRREVFSGLLTAVGLNPTRCILEWCLKKSASAVVGDMNQGWLDSNLERRGLQEAILKEGSSSNTPSRDHTHQ